MTSNSAVVRAYFAACEAGDLTAVDRLFSPDFVSRASDGSTFDLDGQRAALAAFFDEFEDVKLTVHTMLESGDRVVTHYTHDATPRGSGQRASWDRIVIHRVAEGRIVEAVGVSDSKRLADARARATGSPAAKGEDAPATHGPLPGDPASKVPSDDVRAAAEAAGPGPGPASAGAPRGGPGRTPPLDPASDPRFSFPDLPDTYATALREAVGFIASRFPALTALAACGTIVRGAPDRSSDLDLYVIHAEPWQQRLQRFFSCVPAEIFVNPEFQVHRYLEHEGRDGRPITAHMLATGFPVYDPDGVLDRLRERARRVLDAGPPEPHDRVEPRYLIGSLYEDATDVVESDPRTARVFAHRAVWEALQQAFRRTGRFIPRQKEILARLADLDQELDRLAVSFVDEPDHVRAVETAGLIVERVAGVRGFFAWESTPKAVEPPE